MVCAISKTVYAFGEEEACPPLTQLPHETSVTCGTNLRSRKEVFWLDEFLQNPKPAQFELLACDCRVRYPLISGIAKVPITTAEKMTLFYHKWSVYDKFVSRTLLVGVLSERNPNAMGLW